MRKSTFIAIPKVAGTAECNKHRTISLMITKILLRIILDRARNKIMVEVAEEQYGCGVGKGTRNAIFVTRMLIEKQLEVRKDMFLCLIDYEKAFDRVRHPLVIKCLEIDMDGKDIKETCTGIRKLQ